jgi:hypothetical protein
MQGRDVLTARSDVIQYVIHVQRTAASHPQQLYVSVVT